MVRKAHVLTALIGLAFTLAAPASALTVLIDFEAFAGTPALGWNTFDSADSGSVLDLFDVTGVDSGANLALPTVFDNNGAFDGWNGANPLPAWAPNSVADDYVFFTSFITFFTFSGLDPLRTYDFDVIVSRNLSRSQDHRMFTGAGNFDLFGWNSQADGYVAGNTLAWTGLVPTAAGNITLGIRRAGASASLNAIRIVSVDGPPPMLLLGPPLMLWLAAPAIRSFTAPGLSADVRDRTPGRVLRASRG